MTIIKSLVLIRACGSIEPCLFVESYLTMFTTEVFYVEPTIKRNIFLHNTETSRSISRKEIWRISRSGQSTNIIFRGNRDGSWGQIWGLSGSFMRAGSIINGDGRYMQIRATQFICKGIIEAFINCPVFVL